MKRYIIETDDEHIWTYEVEGTDANFSCKLLKPHGDKKYWLEDSEDYWRWFFEEISIIKGAELDICFLCWEKSQEDFQKFYNLIPQFPTSFQFGYLGNAEWKSSEIIRYFQDFRNTKEEVAYEENPSRFMLKSGKTILIYGTENFCLTKDAAFINKSDADSKKIRSSSTVFSKSMEEKDKGSSCCVHSKKKTNLTKHPEKEKSVRVVSKAPSAPAIKKEKSPTNFVGEDMSLEQVNAEDLQRYFERKTEGQCTTVSYRSSAYSEQE